MILRTNVVWESPVFWNAVAFISWGSLLEHQVLEVNFLWAQQDHGQNSTGRHMLSTIGEGITKSRCCSKPVCHYPSCFAHGGIQSSPLLCLNAGTCPASNRTLDYVPPNQHCSCATRIHPEECLCSVRFWTLNWEFQGTVSVKYPCSMSRKQTRTLVQLSWVQNLWNEAHGRPRK